MIIQSSDEILDGVLARLQGIWASPIGVERFEFELKRLERVVGEYRRQEPVRAFYLLGLAATLQEDAKSMRSHFKNALWHSGNDPDVRHGYGACLARLGFFSESREQYQILYREDQGNLDLLAELIVTSLAAGRIQEGVRWIEEWSRYNPERPIEEAESIAKNGALLERFGVSDDDVERLQRLAMGILERESKEVKTINYTGMPPEDPQWISADLSVNEPEDVVEVLNHKLAGVFKSSTPPKLAELVVFGYSSNENKSTVVL
ncbi:MAG: hypothetical protein HQL94_04600 [Magnetococcales bacterium]|nr:hypothetical protein [Magnetococcales bacterium]MBF0439058.1 hypothetical protein [Magnetococcales bacterium]